MGIFLQDNIGCTSASTHCAVEASSPVDVEEGEISSEDEATGTKLKNRGMDRSGKIKLKRIHFASRNVS